MTRKLAALLLTVTALILVLLDVTYFHGTAVSRVNLAVSLALLAGFLCGHLFWPPPPSRS